MRRCGSFARKLITGQAQLQFEKRFQASGYLKNEGVFVGWQRRLPSNEFASKVYIIKITISSPLTLLRLRKLVKFLSGQVHVSLSGYFGLNVAEPH